MPFENLQAGIKLLLQEIDARPEDAPMLQEQLREKLSEMRSLGLPMPADLVQLEKALDTQEGDMSLFENLPV